jgi:hypothetical protein
MRALWRLGLWGITAALALAAAVWAAYSDFGAQRLASAFSKPLPPQVQPVVAQTPSTVQLLARVTEAEIETRRLVETVRTLGAERERLRTRIATLERTLDDVTDSIAQLRSAAIAAPSNSSIAAAAATAVSPVPSVPAPNPTIAATPAPTASPGPTPAPPSAAIAAAPIPALPAPPPPSPLPPLPSPVLAAEPNSEAAWNAALARPPAAVLPSPAPWAPASQSATASVNAHEIVTGSIEPRTEFGIDLGGANTIEGLRTLWTAIRAKHPALLQGLRPIVSLRPGTRPGDVELRLVAGPVTNTGAATRLCGSLTTAGLTCQPAPFEGQQLAGVRYQ